MQNHSSKSSSRTSGCHGWREGHPAHSRTVCLLIAISLARWLGNRHSWIMFQRICQKTWLLAMTLILGISLIGKAQENSEEVAPLKAGYHEIKSKQASGILKKHKDVVILDIRTKRNTLQATFKKRSGSIIIRMTSRPSSPNSTGKSPTWSIVRQEVAAASRCSCSGTLALPGSTT